MNRRVVAIIIRNASDKRNKEKHVLLISHKLNAEHIAVVTVRQRASIKDTLAITRAATMVNHSVLCIIASFPS